jgi:hypothetical protein
MSTSFTTINEPKTPQRLFERLSHVERLTLVNASPDRVAHLAANDYAPEVAGEAALLEVQAMCRAQWAAASSDPAWWGSK